MVFKTLSFPIFNVQGVIVQLVHLVGDGLHNTKPAIVNEVKSAQQ